MPLTGFPPITDGGTVDFTNVGTTVEAGALIETGPDVTAVSVPSLDAQRVDTKGYRSSDHRKLPRR